jgi:hypothetical protein
MPASLKTNVRQSWKNSARHPVLEERNFIKKPRRINVGVMIKNLSKQGVSRIFINFSKLILFLFSSFNINLIENYAS